MSSAHGRHHAAMDRVCEGGVYGSGRGQHVCSMAERSQVTHGHVTGQGRRAEGRTLVVKALWKVLVAVAASLLLRLVGHFAVAGLYSFLLHGQRPVDLRGGKNSLSTPGPNPENHQRLGTVGGLDHDWMLQ